MAPPLGIPVDAQLLGEDAAEPGALARAAQDAGPARPSAPLLSHGAVRRPRAGILEALGAPA